MLSLLLVASNPSALGTFIAHAAGHSSGHTRTVHCTAELKAAMGEAAVGDIEIVKGVYHLAEELGLGDQYSCLVINRNLTIRARLGENVVLSGGQKKQVIFIHESCSVSLQGLVITNGTTAVRRPPTPSQSLRPACAFTTRVHPLALTGRWRGHLQWRHSLHRKL